MSYILDALHKAEKTRQQSSEAPQPQNITAPVTPKASNKHPILLMFLVACSLALTWLLLSPVPTQTKQQVATKSVQKNPNVPFPVAQQPTQDIKPLKEDPEPTSVIDNTPEEVTVPTLLGLPDHIRKELPRITISGHMYAKVAKKRMVIINDQLLHEGSNISENLALTAITPQGVELTCEGVTFSMKSSEQWPY